MYRSILILPPSPPSLFSNSLPSSTADQPQLQKAEKPGGPPVMGLFDNPANPAVKASTPLFPSRSPERRQVRESLADTGTKGVLTLAISLHCS